MQKYHTVLIDWCGKSSWENNWLSYFVSSRKVPLLLPYFDDTHLLNKRSEFINDCRHQNKL